MSSQAVMGVWGDLLVWGGQSADKLGCMRQVVQTAPGWPQ